MLKTRGSARARRREATWTLPAAHLWASRLLEPLWLLAVGLVPLAFAPSGFMAFVDVPKVALLRTLAGLMGVLWAVEWAFRPPCPSPAGVPCERSDEGPRHPTALARLKAWAKGQPGRWAVLAAALFLASSAASLAFSPAIPVALWGREPGRDGYGFYNLACYVLLFLVVATHLKTMRQLRRLLGAVAAAATVAGAYGVLQHFGIDPFHQGAAQRVQSTFGNPLFAASFLAMALPLSLGLAMFYGLARKTPWASAPWVAASAVQLLAVLFTLSRGPWLALAVGLAAWLALVWLAAGRRPLLRAGLLLGAALLLALPAALTPAPSASGAAGDAGVVGRASSIYSEARGGSISGRLYIWQRTLAVITDRPWVEPESPWLLPFRHLFGYGPDLFLYALPLRWAPQSQEVVNASAHSYLLQVTVELGLVGALAFVALVAALAGCGVAALRRRPLAPEHGLACAALLSALVVRVAEQLTGVARVSDMTLFWAVAGALAALPALSGAATPEARARLKEESRPAPTGPLRSPAWRWGAALAVAIIGCVLTWQKNVPYVQAAMLGADGIAAFQRGDLPRGLELMERASDLAPDVEYYYTSRIAMLDSARPRDRAEEVETARRRYSLALEALGVNPLSHTARSQAGDAAMRLAALGFPQQAQEAVALYEGLVASLPGYEQGYTALASAYLFLGQPEKALATLDAHALVADGRQPSALVQYLRGIAYHEAGRLQEAASTLETFLETAPTQYADAAHRRLSEIYASLGRQDLASYHAALYEALRQRPR